MTTKRQIEADADSLDAAEEQISYQVPDDYSGFDEGR